MKYMYDYALNGFHISKPGKIVLSVKDLFMRSKYKLNNKQTHDIQFNGLFAMLKFIIPNSNQWATYRFIPSKAIKSKK